MRCMGLFNFLIGVDDKVPVKSLFNRPKIISCQKWTIGLESGLLQRVKGPTLLNRRPEVSSCQRVNSTKRKERAPQKGSNFEMKLF